MRIGIREKTIGSPPEGNRHTDAINEPVGTHPIEAGIGAVLAGVYLALAVGAVAGPTFAVFGAVLGAVAGACIGNGVGEVIAPRPCAPIGIALAKDHRALVDGAESKCDKDDLEASGSDWWPDWYDPMALTGREQRQPQLGAGVG